MFSISKRTPAILVLALLGCLDRLPAQTTSAAPDSKAIQPPASPVPNHINLWNEDQADDQRWMFHFQNTDITEGQPGFASPYQGPNSLTPDDTLRETVSLDFYMGARLWSGGEFYLNPEYFQGYGFDNTHGIADFPTAEAYKIGSTDGNVILPHVFIRQTFGLGGEQEQLGSDELQLAGKQDISRVTLTFGHFGVTDQFDDNAYSHNQRTQFMGWSMVDGGAFDYAADSFGYTNGFSADLNQKNWAVRYGIFMVSKVSNGVAMDQNLTRAWQQIIDWDGRWSICGHAGNLRILPWLESAHMGSYWNTVNDPAAGEDITKTEKYRYQYGAALSADQEVTKDFGVFTRLSWRDGHSEVWSFTDMDRSAVLGCQLTGEPWGRPDDVVGLADTVGEITRGHATYLNNGGVGPLLGDGHLSYAPENVTETYYDAQLWKNVHFSGNFQLVDNPGYNADRGPVFIFSARLHTEF